MNRPTIVCSGTDGFGEAERLRLMTYFAMSEAAAGPLAAWTAVCVKLAEIVRMPADIGVTVAEQVETPRVAVGASTQAPNTSPVMLDVNAMVPVGLNFW